MPHYTITESDSLFYLHHPPNTPGMSTVVFFNPLTSDTDSWEAAIAPALRERGYGTLSFDYRGQRQSPFSSQSRLTSQGIVKDVKGLLQSVHPARPILVGLSIGGLYAAQCWLEGVTADKLVLINTLRHNGPRLKWIGDALVRAVEIGGLQLFRDMFLPLLMNEDWIQANRKNFFSDAADYVSLSPNSGTYKLLAEAGPSADWDLPYGLLALPTLVVTGLQDHVFLETEVVDKLYAQLPQGKRVDLKQAGHLVAAEAPDLLVDILSDFAALEEGS